LDVATCFKNLFYSKWGHTSPLQKGSPDNKIAGLEFLSISERIAGVFGKRQGPLGFEKTGELIGLN
jgi:hypothetical protein